MYRNFFQPQDDTDPRGHPHQPAQTEIPNHGTNFQTGKTPHNYPQNGSGAYENRNGVQETDEYRQAVNGHCSQYNSGVNSGAVHHQQGSSASPRTIQPKGHSTDKGYTTSFFVNGYSPSYIAPHPQTPAAVQNYGQNTDSYYQHHQSHNQQDQHLQSYNHVEAHIYQQPYAPPYTAQPPGHPQYQGAREYSNIYSVPSNVHSSTVGLDEECQKLASLSLSNTAGYQQPSTGHPNSQPRQNYAQNQTIDYNKESSASAHQHVKATSDSRLYPIPDEESSSYEYASTQVAVSENQNPHVQAVQPNPLYAQRTFHVIPPAPPLAAIFAGRRDVRNPRAVSEKEIVSEKGTVRGFTNRVRAGIATFWAQPEDQIFFEYNKLLQPKVARNYREVEKGKIVVYGTSMSVVRETSERCKVVRNILQNHMVRYEERDLYMSREIQQELRHRLKQEGIHDVRLPQVFADGILIGGAGHVERLNEEGELRALLDSYQKINVCFACRRCGGYRFLPCEFCHGSKRSLLRNHFTEELVALRCMHCDENGLRRCDQCKDQQE